MESKRNFSRTIFRGSFWFACAPVFILAAAFALAIPATVSCEEIRLSEGSVAESLFADGPEDERGMFDGWEAEAGILAKPGFHLDALSGSDPGDYGKLVNLGRFSSLFRMDDASNAGNSPAGGSLFSRKRRDGGQALRIGAGYDFRLNGFTFGPYAKIDLQGTRDDAAPLALEFPEAAISVPAAREPKEARSKSFKTALGGRAAYAFSTSVGMLVPYMRLEWEREHESDSEDDADSSFGAPGGEGSYGKDDVLLITSDASSRDSVNLGLGLTLVLPNGFLAFVDYETIFELADMANHKFAAGLVFEY